jgi:hypothetical protein
MRSERRQVLEESKKKDQCQRMQNFAGAYGPGMKQKRNMKGK